jgi:hypothetical protein
MRKKQSSSPSVTEFVAADDFADAAENARQAHLQLYYCTSTMLLTRQQADAEMAVHQPAAADVLGT